MSDTVLSAVVAAIAALFASAISAVATYQLLRRKDRDDARQRRQSLASALLYEIANLTQQLSSVYTEPFSQEATALIRYEFKTPVLDSFEQFTTLFSPDGVHAILRYRSGIQTLRAVASQRLAEHVQDGTTALPVGSPLGDAARWHYREWVQYAWGDEERAVEALEAAGGTLPLESGLTGATKRGDSVILLRRAALFLRRSANGG